MRVGGMKVHYLSFKTFLYAYREIFVRVAYFFRPTRPNPRILDCGANIGLATIFFKMRWPQSTVTCFEPDPRTFATLSLNLEDNRLQGVQAFNVALWNSDGEVGFYVPRDSAGSLLMSTVPGRADGEKIRVPARRLSSFLGDERVDLLKLDVEGAEQGVLEDLFTSGKIDLVDAIIAEYHHHIDGRRPRLSKFLLTLERSGFDYQLHSLWRPSRPGGVTRDIMIYAIRPSA